MTPAVDISPSNASPPKSCTKCGEDLRIEEFARDKTKANGRKSICKACDREKSRRYYEANRERKLASMAKRRAALREAREATGWRGRRQRWSMAPPGPSLPRMPK